MTLSRRSFLSAASTGAVLTSIDPGLKIALAAGDPRRDIVVSIFTRFGVDGLTMIAPADDANYRDNRPTIAVRAEGANKGLPIGSLDGVPFFMNPNIPELKALYDAKRLAVVHAVGLPTNT